ncbi:hypothetical protein, partial [Dactylosporangium salmoneum]
QLLLLAEQDRAYAPGPGGHFRCVHRAAWTVEATDPGAPEERRDETVCWAEDARGRRTTSVSRAGAAPAPDEPEDLPAGPPPGPAPSTDPRQLADLVTRQRSKADGAVPALLLCIDIADSYPFEPAQQAALLRMLAGQDGLALRDQMLDREQRPGIAISADGRDGKRVTLIFAPADGRLLGARISTPVPAAGGAANVEEVAYVWSGRSDALPQQ